MPHLQHMYGIVAMTLDASLAELLTWILLNRIGMPCRYEDEAEKRKRRHQNMMRLVNARTNNPFAWSVITVMIVTLYQFDTLMYRLYIVRHCTSVFLMMHCQIQFVQFVCIKIEFQFAVTVQQELQPSRLKTLLSVSKKFIQISTKLQIVQIVTQFWMYVIVLYKI